MTIPPLYAILDADLLSRRSIDLADFAAELASAGVTLFQYRNKTATDPAVLNDLLRLRYIFEAVDQEPDGFDAVRNISGDGCDLRLLLHGQPELAQRSGCQGVHLDQDGPPVEIARVIVGPNAWVGTSAHSVHQVTVADSTGCDYIAYGPIFSTDPKIGPDSLAGLAGLEIARTKTRKSLVAFGGITRQNCRDVLDAGADSVAVVSDLVPDTDSDTARQIAEEFFALLA